MFHQYQIGWTSIWQKKILFLFLKVVDRGEEAEKLGFKYFRLLDFRFYNVITFAETPPLSGSKGSTPKDHSALSPNEIRLRAQIEFGPGP